MIFFHNVLNFLIYLWTSQVALVAKNTLANIGNTSDVDLIPGSGGSSGKGNGNQLQYSCLNTFNVYL